MGRAPAARSSADHSPHIESHQALLRQPAGVGTARGALDAIVVPTIRPRLVRTAAELASDIGCTLVVLCSTISQARSALSACAPAPARAFVTYVPKHVGHAQLAFLTTAHLVAEAERSSHADIARKRNIGLLLARLCGWRTIMFLDDDIRDATATAVSRAAGLTARFPVVGFPISHYPDNSVVCHAHRLAGGQQGTFVSGGALVVDTTRYDALFPPVYNEDWLFLFDAVQSRSVAALVAFSQLMYQPFAQPRRAAAEEFGDLIAEGLYRLIHEGAGVADATYAYWQGALNRRFRLIDRIAVRLLGDDTRDSSGCGAAHPADPSVVGCALRSLAAARERLAAISAFACASFISAWQTDLDAWRHRLQGLPVVGDPVDAAKLLNLPILPVRPVSVQLRVR